MIQSSLVNLAEWFFIVIAVGIAVVANSVSAIWAAGSNKFSIWLLAIMLISPLVFITYGLITTKLGVARTSGTIDSLLAVSSILVGLILFQEWHKVTLLQFFGMVFVSIGIFLMLFTAKHVG
jgi:hypothetical protein